MKKIVRIVDKKEAGFDAAYWASKTSQERVDALGLLRAQYVIKNGIRQRLQRVCRVIERK